MRIIFFDIEVYPNYFLVVFYDPYIKEYKTFQLWSAENIYINEISNLKEYLKYEKDSYFTGYNSLGYDMQILTYIVKENIYSVDHIKTFNDRLINEKWPIYNENKLCNKTLDLMLINNYGPKSDKSTSLKKLEFNLRKKKIQDLPYHYNDHITKQSENEEIIKYCKYDIEVTVDVFNFSKELIQLRLNFEPIINENILNSPEPDLAKKFVYKKLSNYMNIPIDDFKKLRTYHNEIKIKDLILPFISFTKDHYKSIYDFYNNLILKANQKSLISDNKVINLKKSINKAIEYDNLKTVYGSGGIHAAVKPGIYIENEDYMITTADFTSYYPHLQFIHNCIAEHIPSELYSKLIKYLFHERKKYEKGSSLNYIYKIFINLLYGLSNSEYSALYDTKATLKTTINGMLYISMIADKIYDIPNAHILMKNTDGLEIYHLKKDKEKIENILNTMSELINIPIEIGYYKKMVILNVNNYIAIDINDKIKTKGLFEDYEDIIGAKMYHKDTSAMIIPKALKEYFIKNIPVEETINNENSIYEFCYGHKGSSMYKWLISVYDDNLKIAKSKIFESRFIRYFAGGDTTLNQIWIKGSKEGTIQAIQANTPVTLLMNVPKENILDFDKNGNLKLRYNKNNEPIYRYPTLNRKWYIDECYKIINKIENNN